MLSSIAAVKTIAAGPFVPPRRNANRRYQTACDTLAALGGTLGDFIAMQGRPAHRTAVMVEQVDGRKTPASIV